MGGVTGNSLIIPMGQATPDVLLPKHPVDPGNAELALLRLNYNVVALLKTVEVILIDGDMLKAPTISPRRNDEAAAARERARGNFSNDCGRHANGARIVQLSIQEKHSRENPRHGNHAEI